MTDEHEAQPQPAGNVHFTEVQESSVNPEGVAKMMRSMHGPQAVDHALRQAVSMCWMMLPEGKKNVDAVEHELRRLLERVITDLREDAQAFSLPEKE